MKYTLLCLSFLFTTNMLFGQERIDGSMDFQTETGKKYSIYVPSSYETGTDHTLMVALHPWNTSRWGARSWCDTLVDFAEKNGLLVLCTDGGSDGKVDDAVDTAFTSTLLDSMRSWYSINDKKVFLMGFSWGARTTYTYGLSRSRVFAGFMPIGAAIALGDVPTNIRSNAAFLPWYVIHGSMDAPNTRFTPMIGMLDDNNALTESNYLSGVGHTIDFPNRNKILSKGFQWLDSVSSLNTGLIERKTVDKAFDMSYSAATKSLQFTTETNNGVIQLAIFDLTGKLRWERSVQLRTNEPQAFELPRQLNKGIYLVTAAQGQQRTTQRILITE